MRDRISILNGLVTAFLTYKRAEERAEIVALLDTALPEIPEDVLERACENLRDQGDYLPNIKAILHEVKSVNQQASGYWLELLQRQLALKEAALTGAFDPAAWLTLAADMERGGMWDTARRTREWAAGWQRQEAQNVTLPG